MDSYDFDYLFLQVLENLKGVEPFKLKEIKEIFDRRKQQLVKGSIVELFLDTIIAEAKELLK